MELFLFLNEVFLMSSFKTANCYIHFVHFIKLFALTCVFLHFKPVRANWESHFLLSDSYLCFVTGEGFQK